MGRVLLFGGFCEYSGASSERISSAHEQVWGLRRRRNYRLNHCVHSAVCVSIAVISTASNLYCRCSSILLDAHPVPGCRRLVLSDWLLSIGHGVRHLCVADAARCSASAQSSFYVHCSLLVFWENEAVWLGRMRIGSNVASLLLSVSSWK